MLEVADRPLLEHVVRYWQRYTNDFIFVVGYRKEQVIAFAGQLPVSARFVEQKEPKGIAHAINCTRGLTADTLVVVLGDCLCRGTFRFPPGMVQGVGVWETANAGDIKQSYSVDIHDGLLRRVEEKPEQVRNNLCGLGFYFFDRRVFGYIERASPSSLRGEVEITDTIQDMISQGEKISPVHLDGDYLNVTFPEDLSRAAKLMSAEVEPISGRKRAEWAVRR
jgi:dTDP-glucose pyrophosphorylase